MRKVYSLLRKCVKWRAVPLIFMAVQSNALAAAQDSSNVSLHFTNQPIENVFIALEKQTGYTVFFSGSTLDGHSRVSVNVSQVSLSDALAAVLRGRNITWTIKHKGIVLSKKPAAPETPASQPANAAARDTVPLIDVAGMVVDPKGNPIPAATVSIKGTSRGQGTDNLGRFSFTKVPGNAILVFSSLGYNPKQIKISGRNEIRVALDSAIREIQAVEVVSTGYQEIPKERATGSFFTLGNEMITRSVSTNILDRILTVTNSLKTERLNNGMPNSSSISIRGFSTINGSKKPLIVIDGFPYEEDNLSSMININNINPNDIESITILRDAAAASNWGSRSGNGVIVITTKKGRFNQKTRLQFNSSVNVFSKPDLSYLKTISSVEAVDYETTVFKSGRYDLYDALYPNFSYFPMVSPAIEIMLAGKRGDLTQQQVDQQLNDLKKHDVKDDIEKYMLTNEINQQYNVNVSGGSEKHNFYMSLGYDRNMPSSKGTKFTRVTFRTENTYRPSEKWEISNFISYTSSVTKASTINYQNLLPLGISAAAPYTYLANPDRSARAVPYPFGGLREAYLDTVRYPNLLDWHYRPLDEQKFHNSTTNNNNVRLGGNVKYRVTPFLNLDVRGQYDKVMDNVEYFKSMESFETRDLINKFMSVDPNGAIKYPIPLGAIVDEANSTQTSYNLRAQVSVNKNWNIHQVTGLAGWEIRQLKYTRKGHRQYGFDEKTGLVPTNMDYNTQFRLRPLANNGTGTVPNIDSYNENLYRYVSYYGNVAYTLNSKYTITASGRIDASNLFGVKANQRNTPLWSVGGLWNISNESFFTSNQISSLKVRATYGYNGNINNQGTAYATGRYNEPGAYGFGLHNFPVVRLLTPPNPGLTWEKIKIINLGVDINLFKDRITANGEIYFKKGINLFGQIVPEPTIGIGTYLGNYASMAGKGMDLSINTINTTGQLQWRSIIQFSYNTDKITEYQLLDESVASYLGSIAPVKGSPVVKIYSYPSAGLDSKNGNPRGYVNGAIQPFDSVLLNAQPEDLRYHGSATPRIFGSFMNVLSYRSLSLSFNITYKFKYFFRRPSIDYRMLATKWGGHSDYSKRWKSPGDENHTYVPSQPTSLDGRENFYRLSSDLVERGDVIRFQDVRLSYTPAFSKNLKLSQFDLSIFAYVNNIGILWKANKQGLDPDYSGLGLIPTPRSYSMGVTLSL